ncbi:hypothetical protein HPB49_010796 [Dermacentor silvarum]|uniref:Uncharacterized protein n=1 Tax=Dermacentor silvarum TaxID=543639 RepID=A0ACB8D4S7_DERSI|nr:hypothetical protein HPB49_010796 [Dermacentor silvarum]
MHRSPQVVAQGRVHRSSRTGPVVRGPGAAESAELATHEDPITRLMAPLNKMVHVWALLAPLALSLTVAVFVPFPSAESCSGFMQLQLMTGMPGWLHCLVNACFDGLILACMAIPVAITFALHYQLELASNEALVVVYICFGVLAILSAYVIAYCSRSIGKAYAITLVMYAVVGSLCMEACLFFATTIGSEDVWPVCTALPPCAVPVAVIKVIVLEWVHLTCEHMAATPVENTTALRALCRDAQDYRITNRAEFFTGLLKLPVDMCCAALNEDAPSVSWSPFLLTPAAVGTELCMLGAYALLLFAYISCRNSGRLFCSESARMPEHPELTNEDVPEVAAQAQEAIGDGASKRALVARDLHKWYDDGYVVRGLSLELKQDECLGLLGVNGCGKSTVARMLCGLTSMSIGECHMPDVQLSNSAREWQSHLGYCPEDDALMDAFTGNEILWFFARLRGVPKDEVLGLVSSAAFVADVGDDGFQLCETYSTGTRRKLLTAVAVIGCPRVVILDDATGGVDLAGREMIYETLQDITRVGASGVLFTSRRDIFCHHSTEECKLACQRVGIMAGGELKALGTMEQLKDKFSGGCTISFRIFQKFTAYVGTAVDKGMQHLFPGARQAECREGVFLYYIDYRLPWSHVFSRINKLRRWFLVESVLVSESSLDEVLLGMARAEQAEDAAEAQLAAKDASRDAFAGDPWGREEQHKHERRQRLRDKRRRRDSPTHVGGTETHSIHCTGAGVGL